MTGKITNPILKGFNPDPSILKAKGKYYIAVSSFEWLPGIRVYTSDNLADWSHKTDILTTQLDLRGNPINCSVWAPQLSYSNRQFHLVYTDVKSTARPFKDCHNYLISANSIEGPWSDPVYLNSSGFDPSLFHDDDGRKWVLNALWDYRLSTSNKSSGIVIQEYSPEKKQLLDTPIKIFDCTHLKKTEAPHMYKRDGYYYLITAEGGTGVDHAVTVARSKSVTGPYEVDPHYPMMTSSGNKDWPIQCAGHGSLVRTENDEWYMAHLMTRPLDIEHSILGRETALQKVTWDREGWLRLDHGGVLPAIEVVAPEGSSISSDQKTNDFFDDFNGIPLNKEWNTLRMPASEEWVTLKENPNHLRLYGGESIQSLFNQHLVGKRQQDFKFAAETQLKFDATCYLETAGLLLYLNVENYIYVYVSHEEQAGKVLRMMKSDNGEFSLDKKWIEIDAVDPIVLRVEVNGKDAQFYYKTSVDGEKISFNEIQNISFLSGGFTGNFIALACQNMNEFKGCYADFAYFHYKGFD